MHNGCLIWFWYHIVAVSLMFTFVKIPRIVIRCGNLSGNELCIQFCCCCLIIFSLQRCILLWYGCAIAAFSMNSKCSIQLCCNCVPCTHTPNNEKWIFISNNKEKFNRIHECISRMCVELNKWWNAYYCINVYVSQHH